MDILKIKIIFFVSKLVYIIYLNWYLISYQSFNYQLFSL